MGGGGWGLGWGRGGQGGCERRIEVFVKIKKTNIFYLGGGGVWGGGGWVGGGFRVDVNEELKFLGKFKQVAQRATIAHLTTSKYF